jgi:single-strand DNA-binding protein
MSSYNRVVMMGNLTQDPELKFVGNNTALCHARLATNRVYIQDGEKKEESCFVDLEIWGKRAETFNQYMNKGRQVLIEGELKYDTWQDKDGNNRSKHCIKVSDFQFIANGKGNDNTSSNTSNTSNVSQKETSPPQINEDDLMF